MTSNFKAFVDAISGKIKGSEHEENKCGCPICNGPAIKVQDILNDYYNSDDFRKTNKYKRANDKLFQDVSGTRTGIVLAAFKVKIDTDKAYEKLTEALCEIHEMRTVMAVLSDKLKEEK